MTSVFQGLSLSRSVGRVGENPWNEVDHKYTVRFYNIFFVYTVVQTSSFFLEKRVADAFLRPLVLIETPGPSCLKAD